MPYFMATLRENPAKPVKLLVGPTFVKSHDQLKGAFREEGDHRIDVPCVMKSGGFSEAFATEFSFGYLPSSINRTQ